MKRLLLLLIITLPLFAEAQSFIITPNGFVNKDDASKDYHVKDIKLSQAELYKKSLLYFNKMFTSPKNVISTVENESITLNFTEKYNIIMGLPWTVNMTYSFEFKDGKIKFNAPSFNKAYQSDGSTLTIITNNEQKNYPIYKRNGTNELRGKDGDKAKQLIETHTNLFLLTYYLDLVTVNKSDW